MKLTNLQNIGTTFKKENIVLATLIVSPTGTEAKMKAVLGDKISEDNLMEKEFFEKMIESQIITLEEPDIFYKDENGYTRFDEGGLETFVGDGSDGKGLIKNVVSVWDYYSEDELKEAEANDSFIIIGVTTREPLKKYNDDYNKWINKKEVVI